MTGSTLDRRPGPDSPFIDVLSSSLDGVKTRMASLLPSRRIEVVWVANDRQMREVLRQQGIITFPFMALQASTIRDQDQGLASKNIQREGVLTGMDPSLDFFARMHCVPIAVDVKVNFLAQTQKDSIDFMSAWKWAEKSGGLRFDLAFDPQPFFITINLVLDSQLQVPDLEEEDVGELFVYETQVTVNTFVAKMAKVPVAKKVNIGLGIAAPQTQGGLANEYIPTFDLVYRLPKTDNSI